MDVDDKELLIPGRLGLCFFEEFWPIGCSQTACNDYNNNHLSIHFPATKSNFNLRRRPIATLDMSGKLL